MASKWNEQMAQEKKENEAPAYKIFEPLSSNLPFGQHVLLSDVSGPTYVTAQTLVQQVAYGLSHRIWAYSPENYDLDVNVKEWHSAQSKNASGEIPALESPQIRAGAATIALGYMFSKDFDLTKRHVPQTVLTSTGALQYLRDALDQLSLLYNVASPLVAHVAAVELAGGANQRLVCDYISVLNIADEVGLGVIASSSAHEAQHLSLLATLLAKYLPMVHVYDGVNTGRETTRVIDVQDLSTVSRNYQTISDNAAQNIRKQTDLDTKVVEVVKAFNSELGTEYGLFEYHGAQDAESLLVVFGSVEAALGAQLASKLASQGVKVGLINVRVYRPFVEEEFLKLVPKSVKTIGVLGQVSNVSAITDPAVQSQLYQDVLAAFVFADGWRDGPRILDIKYGRETVWTPATLAASFKFIGDSSESTSSNVSKVVQEISEPASVGQFSFWVSDESLGWNAPPALAYALSLGSSHHIATSTTHDNLLEGGFTRTDIRRSAKTIEFPFAIQTPSVVYVDGISILKKVNVLAGLPEGGKILLNLPGVKDEDLEKKLPADFRRTLQQKGLKLYILDPSLSEVVQNDPGLTAALVEIGWVRTALPSLEQAGIDRLSGVNYIKSVLGKTADDLDKTLRSIEVPAVWGEAAAEEEKKEILPASIKTSSFSPFKTLEKPEPSLLKDWQSVAKSLLFKESYESDNALRPDQTTKTYEVTLTEHRRLTPVTYDRNIMHLSFDLGESGLKYNIGDSLGIHPRNDVEEVNTFIRDYGLNAEAVVEIESREGPHQLMATTVFQALSEQVDIYGRPGRQFYEQLADFATDETEKKTLLSLGGLEGTNEFKRRAEVDTVTFVDILEEFPSARPPFHELIKLITPIKRREYSIASCQKVTPTAVELMIVTVGWVDSKKRDRFGLGTRYLNNLPLGSKVTVSLKPSVMKLPAKPTDPIIMAGLGTGLAPFRAFVQHRAWEKAQGTEIGPVLLYMGSRHQREEYCYGEEWEAYRDAGVITLLACAFSRDQKQKIYIQDRMRQSLDELVSSYMQKPGAFYLCGPTWPVPDVTAVLEEAMAIHARMEGKKPNTRKQLEQLKEENRYILEVY